jgi:hypothetical protein
MKTHKKITKYLILLLHTKNWTRSLHIKFRKCLSRITKLLCDSIFCLITMYNSQKFLFIMNLIKFILFNILTNRHTFCSFKCFNDACHMFKISLLTARFDSMSDVLTNHLTNDSTNYLTNVSTRLSTINVMMKL